MKPYSMSWRIPWPMKKLLSIFLLISGSLQAQNNKLVLQFVDEHYGERVGSGVCIDLVYGAWGYVNQENGFRDSVADIVSAEDVMPGDIVEFDSVMCSDGHFIRAHIGIVYQVSPGGVLSVAQQNVGSDAEMIMYNGEAVPLVKDSHVLLRVFILSEVVSGKVIFTRI